MEDLLNRKLTYLYDHHYLTHTFQLKHNSFGTLNFITENIDLLDVILCILGMELLLTTIEKCPLSLFWLNMQLARSVPFPCPPPSTSFNLDEGS